MTDEQIEALTDDLRTNPKCEGMDEIQLEIIAHFMQADQETQDIALGMLGTIGVATRASLLQ